MRTSLNMKKITDYNKAQVAGLRQFQMQQGINNDGGNEFQPGLRVPENTTTSKATEDLSFKFDNDITISNNRLGGLVSK